MTWPHGDLPRQKAAIREVVRRLTPNQGDRVSLVDVRAALPSDVPRAEVDAALKALVVEDHDTVITPQSNRKALSDDQRAAAVWVGGQEKHFIAVDV